MMRTRMATTRTKIWTEASHCVLARSHAYFEPSHKKRGSYHLLFPQKLSLYS